MKKGLIMTGVTLLLTLSGIGLTSIAGGATYKYIPTTMTINGHQVETPMHIAAVDPMSPTHNMTSFVPLWYVQQVLFYGGIWAQWNGHTLSVQTPYPNSSFSAPAAQTLNNNTMDITVNGKVFEYAPMIQYHDAGTSILTTYVPIWYIQQMLKNSGAVTSWNGTDMVTNIKFPDGWVAPVLTQTWNSSMTDAQIQSLCNSALGLKDGGLYVPAQFTYQQSGLGIYAGSLGGETNEAAQLNFNGWATFNYTKATMSYDGTPNETKGYYRIPIVAADLFHFYFPNEWYKMWWDMGTANFPETSIIDGRYVITSNISTGVEMDISVPGKLMTINGASRFSAADFKPFH
jgi:hypothetical protein